MAHVQRCSLASLITFIGCVLSDTISFLKAKQVLLVLKPKQQMKANKQVNKIQRKCKTPRLQLDAYQDLLDDKKGKKVINLFLYCVPL